MAFCFPFIQLLGVDPWVLLEALTHRKIEAKTEEVKMALVGNVPTLPAAAASRMVRGGQTPGSCPPGPVWSSLSASPALTSLISQHPTITSSSCFTLALLTLAKINSTPVKFSCYLCCRGTCSAVRSTRAKTNFQKTVEFTEKICSLP